MLVLTNVCLVAGHAAGAQGQSGVAPLLPCLVHKRPYVGASHARSWSPLLVLGAILWAFIAKN